MLYDFFSANSSLASFEVKETFDQLYIKASLNNSQCAFVTKLFDELKTLSSRDSFELFLEISGATTKISNTSSEHFKELTDHLAANEDEDDYEIIVDVKKVINENTVSVYFMEHFAKHLNDSPLKDIFITLSSIHGNGLFFEAFSTIVPFNSSGMYFYSSGQPIVKSDFLNDKKRSALLGMLSENSNITDVNLKIVPSDFYLIVDAENHEINKFFSKACGVLSLIFMANASGFKSKNELAYRICGFKTISCDSVSFADVEADSKVLYKLMSWSFEGGSCADKIGLLRNVLSIHLDDSGSIKFDNEVWNTVRSNYQIYLKGNIQNYLDVKNKIGEIIIESTTKTYAIADDLLDVFKNNVFVILTFILTVVVVNGVKDNGSENIFSGVYLAIVIILCLVSSMWLVMTAHEAKKRFEAASRTIKDILNLNYKKIIMDSEIDDSVDPVLKSNKDYLDIQIKRYVRWWMATASIVVISFVIGYLTLGKPKSADSVNDVNKEKAVLTSQKAGDAKTVVDTQKVENTKKVENTQKVENTKKVD
ncbi:hypothetical protein [Shewanella sp. AC91-MNA-CIBAN-0169]|uniref:hypothetical protein n=1 Tax=Shewanella sp. AC91-MNA-CIBAN-0169 TaxID=3140466 RepID=UPI00331F403E